MLARVQRNVLAGVLIVIPVWLTVWVITFLIELLIRFGRPAVSTLAHWIEPTSPTLSQLFNATWFQSTVAVVIVLFGLYVLGTVGRAVIGRRVLASFDVVMDQIPLVQIIYGAARRLVTTLQAKPDGLQRVVVIPFPSPHLKAVGLVTRTFLDGETGEEIAAVFVPTTPNPSSGYVELVPTDQLVQLDWTVNEALTFILSGGAVAPNELKLSRSISTVGSMHCGSEPTEDTRR